MSTKALNYLDNRINKLVEYTVKLERRIKELEKDVERMGYEMMGENI